MDFFIQNFSILWQISLAGATVVALYYALRNDIRSLRVDISYIKENQKSLAEAFAQLGNILTKVAVQDTRLNMVEKKLDELAHGQGFISTRKN